MKGSRDIDRDFVGSSLCARGFTFWRRGIVLPFEFECYSEVSTVYVDYAKSRPFGFGAFFGIEMFLLFALAIV